MGNSNGRGDDHTGHGPHIAEPSVRFLDLVGIWRQIANLGLAVVMAGLLVYLVAGQRTDQLAQIEAAREAHRSIAELTAMIRENRDALRALDRTLRSMQARPKAEEEASGR